MSDGQRPPEPEIRATDELTALERRGLIDSMRPEDAEPVPELREVEVPDGLRRQIEEAMSRYPQLRSAALPALWAVQRHYGWCSPEGMRQAAAVMGRHQVLVCHNISCWLRGADELLEAFCDAAGVEHSDADHGGISSADGDFFVKGFECMGACDLAPMASIDQRYFGPLEPADARTMLDQLRAGEEVLPEKALAKRPAAGGPEPEPDPRVAELERGRADA
jgi:NADH-quinone oxidoreductase subunit E